MFMRDATIEALKISGFEINPLGSPLCMYEWRDDHIIKGVLVAIKKLELMWKFPKLWNWRIVRVIWGAWCEIYAFISYERRKLYTDFTENVRRCVVNGVFNERIEYSDEDRVNSLRFSA